MRNYTTSDSTSIVVDELEQGLNYFFSVRAVDLIGREGTISETVTLTMDGMWIIILKINNYFYYAIIKFRMLLST